MGICFISTLRGIAGIAQGDAVGKLEDGRAVGIVVDGIRPGGIDGEGHAGRVGSLGAVGSGAGIVRFRTIGVCRAGPKDG